MRCMSCRSISEEGEENIIPGNTDRVLAGGECVPVQSLEFYYENAEPDPVYYEAVKQWREVHK